MIYKCSFNFWQESGRIHLYTTLIKTIVSIYDILHHHTILFIDSAYATRVFYLLTHLLTYLLMILPTRSMLIGCRLHKVQDVVTQLRDQLNSEEQERHLAENKFVIML